MGHFVNPEPHRLSLDDGEFITIKKRLNHGEREDMFAIMSPHVTPGETALLDRRVFRTAKVAAYLIGWSLTNEGTPVEYSPDLPYQARVDILRALDADTFNAIYAAINTHEDAMDAERAAKKKELRLTSRSVA